MVTRSAARWSTAADVATKVRRRWDSGELLASFGAGDGWEPTSVPLRAPSPTEFGENLDSARAWIAALEKGSRRGGRAAYRLEYKPIGGRLVGANQIPARAWLDSFDAVWTLLGVHEQVRTFESIVAQAQRSPQIATWILAHPIKALELEPLWPRLLDAAGWISARVGSGIYLRQIDVPGVDTKFIEAHATVLAELIDCLVEPGLVDSSQSRSAFALRYGFRVKPQYLRFRLLSSSEVFGPGLSELQVRIDELADIDPEISTVFVVENEITYLAFPPVPDSMVLFGGGYAVSRLAGLPWLANRALYYWGDIDTHGFVMLNRLRQTYPQARSILMDRATLLAHEMHWVHEQSPVSNYLDALTGEESELYRDLVEDALGPSLRLEQERVNFAAVVAAVDGL